MEHILVKFKPDTKVTGRFKAEFELEDDGELPEIRVKKFKVPPGKAHGLVRRLKQHLDVEDAEIDGEMQGIPMEVAEGNQWYQAKLGCLDAWKETTGFGVSVAVLDSGIDFAHPYLTGRQVEEKCFVALESTVTDSDGHGTACAGLVLAIAKNAMLYNGRVMSANSAKWSAVAAGILWAKDRCKIISLSIGGPTDSFTLIDAMMKANEAGAVVLCAAGNAGSNTKAYPAATKGAYAVSATDEADNKAGFSQWGDWIAVSAPGTNLLTTTRGGGFGSFSGTSGSAPIAAGVTALSLAKSGGTGQEALSRVLSSAKKLEPTTYFGAGRVDAAAAVGAVAVTPPPPPPPPPPPQEPPPVDTDIIDITSLASITCDFPAFEAGGEGLASLTDGTNKKALWFRRFVTLTFNLPDAYEWHGFKIRSANDYPQRDPNLFVAQTETSAVLNGFIPAFSGRFTEQSINFALVITGKKLSLYLENPGETSPGDKGDGILQLAELRILGKKAAVTEPPPPPPPPPLSPIEQAILDAGLTGDNADLARAINGVMPADAVIDGEPEMLAWHLTNGAIVALAP